jgi:hypothetical protein
VKPDRRRDTLKIDRTIFVTQILVTLLFPDGFRLHFIGHWNWFYHFIFLVLRIECFVQEDSNNFVIMLRKNDRLFFVFLHQFFDISKVNLFKLIVAHFLFILLIDIMTQILNQSTYLPLTYVWCLHQSCISNAWFQNLKHDRQQVSKISIDL